MIAIFGLLPQKGGIEDLDRELFDLLATQAAFALYCTGLHAKVALDPGARPPSRARTSPPDASSRRPKTCR